MATKVRAKPKPQAKSRSRAIRLSAELFDLVEEAAIRSEATVTEFVTQTLESSARDVIRQQTVTVLSTQDAERFLTILNDTKAEPNAALKAAVKQYRKQIAQD